MTIGHAISARHAAASIGRVSAHAFTVPTDAPEGDGTASWDATTLVVVQVDAEGRTGTGWTYGPTACADVVDGLLAPVVLGADPLAVQGTWAAMVRAARNATRAGVVGYAISAVDVALWDLKAQLLDLPLADLLGRVHDVPLYGSGGFTTYRSEQLTDQLTRWVHVQRIPRVKMKIGESWGRKVGRDLSRIKLARDCIGPDAQLYVDANGAYTAKKAIRVMDAASDAGVTWLEEPVTSDDLPGLHQVRQAVRADVAAGEYGSDLTYFRRMCDADAVDCLQIDATRCGGYTEWIRAAAVAAAHHLDVSAHCAPNLHVPIAAATTNLRHVEWFHDHDRIERQLFTEAADPTGGVVSAQSDRPGHGLQLDADSRPLRPPERKAMTAVQGTALRVISAGRNSHEQSHRRHLHVGRRVRHRLPGGPGPRPRAGRRGPARLGAREPGPVNRHEVDPIDNR